MTTQENESTTPLSEDEAVHVPAPNKAAKKVKRALIALALLFAGMTILKYTTPQTVQPLTGVATLSAEPTTKSPIASSPASIPPITLESPTETNPPPVVAPISSLAQPSPLVDVSTLDDRLALIEAKLKEQAELEESNSERTNKAWQMVTLWQAYDALKTKVLNGEPYASQLADLRAIAEKNTTLIANIEPLRSYESTGLPTKKALEDAFTTAMQEALKETSSPDDGAIVSYLKRHLRGVVTIRKIGATEGKSLDASVRRVELALQAENYTECLNTLEAPPAEAQESFYTFTTSVRGRVNALRALDTIRTELTAFSKGERG